MTAAMAGKPSPASNGTATAAGVPKPAEPSIKVPNSHAMIMTCTRRSAEMPVKPSRIVCSPPLSCSVLRSAMAPKMMKISVAAMTTPLTEAATTPPIGTCQTNNASDVQTA